MRHPFIRLFEACSKKTDDSVETANDLLFVSFAQIPQEEHTGGQETSQDKQVETINWNGSRHLFDNDKSETKKWQNYKKIILY